MRTIPLKQVFQGVSTLLGAELVTPGSTDFIGIMASINAWLPVGWEYDFWPEWTPAELRYWRDTFSDTATYAAGKEIYFPDDATYYSANSAPNTPTAGQSPQTHPTKWTELTAFAKYIALDQARQTPIGAVKRLCRRDPDLYPEAPGEIDHMLSNKGIVPDSRAGASIYLEFRKQPPVFSADEYSAVTAYAAGDVKFYSTTWECYKALQATTGHAPTDTTYWEKVDFPYLLKRFVEQACYAATLKPDGAADKASAELALAYSLLIQAQDIEIAQQGQNDSVRVTTY